MRNFINVMVEALDAALPMDHASRMRRAKEQGFTIDAYHGTRQDIIAFNIDQHGENVREIPKVPALFFTDHPIVADIYSNWNLKRNRRGQTKALSQNTLPVKLKIENPYVVDASSTGWWNVLEVYKHASTGGHDGFIVKGVGHAHPDGYTGNLNDTIYAIFRANQVRSRFARFDPNNIDNADIMG